MYKKLILMLTVFFSMIASAQKTSAPDTVISNDRIFIKVDKEAAFPGGNKGWSDYLSKALGNFNPSASGSPAGKFEVVVKFVVDLDGSLSSIEPETNFGFGMEEQVIATIKKSGAWEPALVNGKPVKAYRRQPITFMVEDEAYTIHTKVPYVLFANTDNILTIEFEKNTKDVQVSISEGTITTYGEDGRYIVRVSKPGRVVIDITAGKKNRKIGSSSFEVRKQ